ncbi:flagellar filament capping protein FliD [Halanaerobium sp. Z-7514]|uniref:Flagellar hook-associated protein 2 n=1 Tax=Halanaerobium polyolivorans TaxID=2886943 RepID=A0AAW4WVN2_9FIRM|nr:flagellar filament capping protein FliD [Halanaerobium polyolivorans]MCC3145165.1 flagellar filament capping protein FliD [Halanaerobium polyolivorans]
MVQGISLSGLASGMETDNMVEELMAIERAPIKRMELEKQQVEVKREQWQQINQFMQEIEGSFNELRSRGSYREMEASSTNEDLLTVSASSSADRANYEVRVEQLARGHSIHSDRIDSASEPLALEVFGAAEEELDTFSETFIIDAADSEQSFAFEIDGSTNLRELRNMINAEEDLDISASVVDNRLVLESKEMGADNIIEAERFSANFAELGILAEQGEIAYQMQSAQDAIFSINGMEVVRSQNEGLDDVIDGLTIDLHGSSENESFNLSVNRDNSQLETTLSDMAEQYNNLATFMGELGKEDGLLQGDGTLRRLQNSLRRQITNSVGIDNPITNIQQLGIDIDQDGVMSFDSSELNDALREDSGAVEKFFRASQADDGADGFGRRMYDFSRDYIRFGDGVLSRQDNNFESRLNRIDRRIEYRENRLETRERSLQRQFAAMEVALNDIQGQSSWLQGQLQGLNSNNN